MLRAIQALLSQHRIRSITDEEFKLEREKILRRTPVPVFWLLGKTQSGKTSIIKFLTGAEEAQIGNGFRPETKRSFRYHFPSADIRILDFLDTRGLGEESYDPADDIKAFNASAHVIIVTVRARDQAVEDIIEPLKKIRASQPKRPVLLAVTCLHQTFPRNVHHPEPDPFAGNEPPTELPGDLARCLEAHRERFGSLVDRIVPIDLTNPDEGFREPNFGGDRLKAALVELLPDAYRQTFMTLDDVMGSLKTLHERKALPYVLGSSTMAATAAAFPVPLVDVPAVAAIQTSLVYKLAGLYGQTIERDQFWHLAGAVGGRMLLRSITRELLKVVPGVGIAVNSALAFAYTYALGKACCWYYGERSAGHAPTRAEINAVMKEQLSIAKAIWDRTRPLENLR